MQTRFDGAFGLVSLDNGTSPVIVFDIINTFQMTNCLACRYPKNDKLNHHMQQYNILKEFGLNFTYTPETNICPPKVAKHHNEKAKKAEKKKKEKKAHEPAAAAASNPSTPTSNNNSIPTTSVQSGRAAVNLFTMVGKNGGNAKTEAEAKTKGQQSCLAS